MIHAFKAPALVLLALAVPATAFAGAQEVTVMVEVDPGTVEHRDVLASIELRPGHGLPADMELSMDYRKGWSASVTGVSTSLPGISLQGQVNLLLSDYQKRPRFCYVPFEDGPPQGLVVRWVEPFLPADQIVERSITLRPAVVPFVSMPATSGASRSGFLFHVSETQLDLTFDDRLVWRDVMPWDPERYTETYKPFHHLYAPDAPVPLTKGVGGKYSHHRGVFLGWGKTRAGERTVNFWHMPPSESSQRMMGYDMWECMAGPAAARVVSTVWWLTKEDEILVEDDRDVTTWRVADGWLFDYRIELRSRSGEVQLDGDPAHGGFQFRAAQSVAEANSCTYLRPESAVDQGNDNWADCAWVAARFPIDGRQYEVAFFDHPDNPRPTVYNTRAYGRFGPFFRATLKEGEPLVVRYRLLVRGLPETAGPGLVESAAERLEREYASYTNPIAVQLAR